MVLVMSVMFHVDTLLRNAAEFVDKLMEIDEELCTQWSCPELVLAVMEAVKQIGYSTIRLTTWLCSLFFPCCTREVALSVSVVAEIF